MINWEAQIEMSAEVAKMELRAQVRSGYRRINKMYMDAMYECNLVKPILLDVRLRRNAEIIGRAMEEAFSGAAQAIINFSKAVGKINLEKIHANQSH